MAEVAKYSLEKVFQLIREKNYWFSAPSRSVREVQRVYSTSSNAKTVAEAEKLILDGIFSLTSQNFYKRQIQWEIVVDLYGLIFDNKPWYVKFAIVDEENKNGITEEVLQQISFHPPGDEFVTTGGLRIPAESVTGESAK